MWGVCWAAWHGMSLGTSYILCWSLLGWEIQGSSASGTFAFVTGHCDFFCTGWLDWAEVLSAKKLESLSLSSGICYWDKVLDKAKRAIPAMPPCVCRQICYWACCLLSLSFPTGACHLLGWSQEYHLNHTDFLLSFRTSLLCGGQCECCMLLLRSLDHLHNVFLSACFGSGSST